MDKTLVGLMMIFFLAFTVFITFVVFNKQIATVTRANAEVFSPAQSLIFAWPLNLKADNTAKSEVKVFVRNEEGRAISDRIVRLNTSLGTVDKQTAVTDQAGQAIFIVTSAEPGLAEIEAVVDNIKVTRTVTLKFE